MFNNDIVPSCKIDSKLNWDICEIAIPSKILIELFSKSGKNNFTNCEYLFEEMKLKNSNIWIDYRKIGDIQISVFIIDFTSLYKVQIS